MTDFLLLVRNVVLAAILAWLGIEYAPSSPDTAPENKPDGSVTIALTR